MAGNPSALGAVSYSAETTYAEDVDTIATRLEVLSRVDTSGLEQEQLDTSFTEQYPGEGYRVIPGPHGGSFSIQLPLTGHGADPADGALTATDLFTLLAAVLGGSHSTNDGGTADGTGTATAFGHTGATVANYTGIRVGTRGDGRGNGQFCLATAESGGTITVLNALAGVPNAADVIRAALSVYPLSVPSSLGDCNSLRVLLQTSNRQYLCHGCYLTGIEISGWNARQSPSVTLTFGVGWWGVSSATFPSALTAAAKTPSANGGGSLFLNSSSAHQTFIARDFSVAFEVMADVIESTCTDNALCAIAAVKYGGIKASISATVDYSDAIFTHYDAGDSMRLVYTLSSEPGKAIGLAVPNAVFSAKPTQVDSGGRNAVSFQLQAKPSGVTTDDRSLAPFHLLMG